MSFHEMILFNGRRWPNRPAVVMLDHSVTYGQLSDGIRSVAAELRRQGIGKGQIIGIQIVTPTWHLAVIGALAEIGAVSMSLSLVEPIQTAGVRLDAVIAQVPHKMKPSVKALYMHESWFQTPATGTVSPGRSDPDEIARIATSSGTTGHPKTLAYSGKEILERSKINVMITQAVAWERMLLLLPLTVNFGFQMALTCLSLGRTLCFASSPDLALKVTSLFCIDFLMGSNGHISDYVDLAERSRATLPTLKFCYVGGSMTTKTLSDRLSRVLRSEVMFGYGSAECGPVAFAYASASNICDGIGGYVAPWAELEIVDEAGSPVATGIEGRLRVRSGNNGRPYLTEATKGTDFTADGWHEPGDIGRFEPDGLLMITGRSDDLINSGGTKVQPELLEEALRSGPGVHDVAVVEVVNSAGISEIWAAVASPTPVNERALGDWAWKHVALAPIGRFLQVPKIPRTPSGKVVRAAVKSMLLGLKPTQ